ncbi:MAG: hypothetical protein QOG64_2633 [Acidimicrobiaceae bacterium]|jgi:hypothetical protein|nr:hypothetical protein [Acidimicrobiaceae bacterium]
MKTLAGVLVVLGIVVGTTAACGKSGNSASAYCTEARKDDKDAGLSNLGQSTDPKQLQADFDRANAAAQRLKSKAPKEIKADITKAADAIAEITKQVKASNGDLSKIDSSTFNASDFQAVSDRIDKFNADKCGITSTSSTTTAKP